MNTRTSPGPATCGKCGEDVGTTFKIQGQSSHVCADCLASYSEQQGLDKTVTIDGIHRGNYGDNTALGPSGQGGTMN